MDQEKDHALRAAEALKEQFSIGTFSQFCDDPTDFDEASTEEIARIIRTALALGLRDQQNDTF